MLRFAENVEDFGTFTFTYELWTNGAIQKIT